MQDNILHSAKQGNHREVHGLLQCPDSNVNVRDAKGHTALFIASMNNHFKVIEVLLDNPFIDPNQGVTLNGGTAFSIASEKSHFKIMEQLVTWDLIDDIKIDVSQGWCEDSWTSYPISKCNDKKQHVQISEKPIGKRTLLSITQ